MKTIAIVSGVLATSLAAPFTSPAHPLSARTDIKCPPNTVQPDGHLPPDSISTSILVPISSKHPDTAFPSSDWATITPNDICTIFNLDVPAAATQGKICTLVFDFPSFEQAPALFFYSGPGHFAFTGYAVGVGAVPGVTTFANQPAPGPSPPSPPPVLEPGNSYIVNSAPCGIPPEVQGLVTVSGSLCSEDTTFWFKQSDVDCPLGFYVVLTDDTSTKV
ncbi:hypothetical protein K505DRAFT_303258 [Melanomma pulvis-pyrius CBS 109.77]|uniref:Ubiquitin 3 binding protein But2 C-terminal domain-containing protein n=1 Tax=Melanomma pulvis-pyrius CBS 109.77 TaxID=1314802 RepID=A0A6A6XE27_9PLEO|nr:hypothetical protein K505DRAFT_303258 [Melanomma pulvis-pyrius CBS 109.77]